MSLVSKQPAVVKEEVQTNTTQVLVAKADIAVVGVDDEPSRAIAERLPSLPEPVRSELRRAVRERYAGQKDHRQRAWFEWNRASNRAERALDASFSSP
jgi:hypothetical protein